MQRVHVVAPAAEKEPAGHSAQPPACDGTDPPGHEVAVAVGVTVEETVIDGEADEVEDEEALAVPVLDEVGLDDRLDEGV